MISAMSRELVIYCDESVKHGTYFSNFYGGLLVPAKHLQPTMTRMNALKESLGLRAEIKWSSITGSVSERYCEMMCALFEELAQGHIKIRIMFTQNRDLPVLTTEQRATTYHRLYYQFIKHAFGLEYAGCSDKRCVSSTYRSIIEATSISPCTSSYTNGSCWRNRLPQTYSCTMS